jgi:excisionase family DNA binding protein
MTEPKAMLTIPMAASRLQISTSLAWRLSREGRLPVTRINRAVRIDPDALDRWIAEQTEPAR